MYIHWILGIKKEEISSFKFYGILNSFGIPPITIISLFFVIIYFVLYIIPLLRNDLVTIVEVHPITDIKFNILF